MFGISRFGQRAVKINKDGKLSVIGIFPAYSTTHTLTNILKLYIDIMVSTLTLLKIFFTVDQDQVRLSRKDFESERAKMYGPQDKWHHLDCFVNDRDELEFTTEMQPSK